MDDVKELIELAGLRSTARDPEAYQKTIRQGYSIKPACISIQAASYTRDGIIIDVHEAAPPHKPLAVEYVDIPTALWHIAGGLAVTTVADCDAVERRLTDCMQRLSETRAKITS